MKIAAPVVNSASTTSTPAYVSIFATMRNVDDMNVAAVHVQIHMAANQRSTIRRFATTLSEIT